MQRVIGLIVCVLGWLIAVMSVRVPGVYAQLMVAAGEAAKDGAAAGAGASASAIVVGRSHELTSSKPIKAVR